MQPPKSQLPYWILQLGGWGLFTLLQIYGVVDLLGVSWGRAAAQSLPFSGAGLGLTHWLRSFARNHHWSTLRLRALIWRIVAAGFVLGTPLGIVSQFTDLSAMHDPRVLLEGYSAAAPQIAMAISIVLQVLNWAALFMVWLAIYFTVLAIRRHRSAELQQSELARALQLAELRLLKAQLNPHFLFNALNTVRSLIADDPQRAQSAVTRLANILRYTLNSGQDETVSLAQEIEIVSDYLEIESMRFEARLRIERNIAANAGSARIPVMLLQTVVENAIKHGIADLPEGGLLRISAGLEEGVLVLEVENPRAPAAAPAAYGGIGLRNSDERLRLLFGPDAGLELDLSRPDMAVARIRIPQHP